MLSHFSHIRLFEVLCPWDAPGKNIELGCHFLLQVIFSDPGTEPPSLASPALAGRFFTIAPPGRSLFHMCVCVLVPQSYLNLCDPMDCSLQASPSMGFSRKVYWSGLPCLLPGHLPDSGMETASHVSCIGR